MTTIKYCSSCANEMILKPFENTNRFFCINCDRMEFINEKDKQPSYSTDKRNTEMPVATPYGEEMMEEEVNSTEPLPVIVAITEEEKEVEEIEEDEEEDL